MTHTHTLGRISLDEGSARHRDIPVNTSDSQQTDIQSPEGLEPLNSAILRPQTQALGRVATEIGKVQEF